MYNYISSERTKKTMGIQLLVSVLLFAAAVPVVAEEVTQQFNGLTLNANLELADGRTLEDGVVLILHGTMGHNRMEIIEASQRALLENGQNSLAINLSLGVDNRHGFFDCERPHRHLQDATGTFGRVAFRDVFVVTQDYRTDRIALEVQRHTVGVTRKLDHLARHNVSQTVNARDTVHQADNRALGPGFGRTLEVFDAIFDQFANF